MSAIMQLAAIEAVTRLLMECGDIIPAPVLDIISEYNSQLKADGVRLRVTRYDDGIGKGWIVGLERL